MKLLEHFISKDKANRVKNWKNNKEKSGNLYVKWKAYSDKFNSWVDKEDI